MRGFLPFQRISITMHANTSPITESELIQLWSSLRVEVESDPDGLADNVFSGCCGDNLDVIITRSGGRAEMCDLASFAINVGDSIHNPTADWDHAKLSTWPNVQPPPGLSWVQLRQDGWIAQAHVWTVCDQKHFDIEAPQGVDNPFHLNDIRTGLVEFYREHQPALFATLANHPWWLESIGISRRFEGLTDRADQADDLPN